MKKNKPRTTTKVHQSQSTNIYRLFYFLNQNLAALLLVLLCAVIFVSHSLYVAKTYQYPHEDEHIYLGMAMQYRDILRHFSGDTIFKIIYNTPDKQPVYPFVISLAFLLINPHNLYKTALFLNVFYYIGTIIGVYFLSRLYFKKSSSFIAAFLYAIYGFPLFYLHFLYTETAATTFVVWSLVFLVKSKYFSIPKHTVLFALFLAMGSLIRWVVPLFVLAPLVLTLLISLVKIYKKEIVIANYIKSLLIFLFVGVGAPFLLYYLPNHKAFFKYVFGTSKYAPGWIDQLHFLSPDLKNTFSVHSLMFYFNVLSQLNIYFFLLFSIGLLLAIIRFKKYFIVTSGFLVAYAIFTFFSVLKMDRYIVPIYPFMGVISAIGIDYLKNTLLRTLTIFVIITIGILSFLGSSWGIGPLGQQGLKDIVLPSLIQHPRRIYLTSMVWPPRPDEMNADKIINVVEKDALKNKKNHVTLVNTFTYNPLELDIALSSITLYQNHPRVEASHLRVIKEGDYISLLKQLERADYLLMKDKHIVTSPQHSTQLIDIMPEMFNKAMEQQNARLPDAFIPIMKIYSPLYKRDVYIYKKTREIKADEWKDFLSYFKAVDQEHLPEIDAAIISLGE